LARVRVLHGLNVFIPHPYPHNPYPQTRAGHETRVHHYAEQTPLPPKKKMKTSVKPSQPSATTTAVERNNRGAPSNTKRMDNGAKKRPTGDESDASVDANPAHPAKKAKVDKPVALTKAPIRRSGKIILNF
jgi:hypothetical protein